MNECGIKAMTGSKLKSKQYKAEYSRGLCVPESMSQGEKPRARAVAVCYGTEVLSAEENRVPPDHMLFWGIGPWSVGARGKSRW